METYIYWIVTILAVESAAKIILLATSKIPERTPMNMAIDVFIGIGLTVWGMIVLANNF